MGGPQGCWGRGKRGPQRSRTTRPRRPPREARRSWERAPPPVPAASPRRRAAQRARAAAGWARRRAAARQARAQSGGAERGRCGWRPIQAVFWKLQNHCHQEQGQTRRQCRLVAHRHGQLLAAGPEVKPGVQLAHVAAPEPLKVPSTHDEHADAPAFENVPAPHMLLSAVPAPRQMYPAVQGVQAACAAEA